MGIATLVLLVVNLSCALLVTAFSPHLPKPRRSTPCTRNNQNHPHSALILPSSPSLLKLLVAPLNSSLKSDPLFNLILQLHRTITLMIENLLRKFFELQNFVQRFRCYNSFNALKTENYKDFPV